MWVDKIQEFLKEGSWNSQGKSEEFLFQICLYCRLFVVNYVQKHSIKMLIIKMDVR